MFDIFDDNNLATKGDVNRDVQKHVQKVQHQINNVYNNMASHMNYLREETNQKMNQLHQNLTEQSKKFEELEKKLNNPLANQSNELRNRAIESFNNGWLEEAKEEIVKALELNNKDFVSQLIFARIYKKEGKVVDKAIEHYDLAIKYSEPYDREFWKNTVIEKTSIYLEIARNYVDSDLDKAIEYYNLALNTVKKVDFNYFQQIVIEKALAYYRYGLLEKALEVLNNIGNKNVLVKVFYYKAWILIDLNQLDEAFQNIVIYLTNILDIDTILNENHFEPIKEKIEEWIQKEIDPIYNEMKELLNKCKLTYEEYNKKLESFPKLLEDDIEKRKRITDELNEILELSNKIQKLLNKEIDFLYELKDYADKYKETYTSLIVQLEKDFKEYKSSFLKAFWKSRTAGIILFIIIIILYLNRFLPLIKIY